MWLTFRHEAMATFFQIAVAGHDDAYAKKAAAAAFREVDRLEQELSRFVPSSDIARCNGLSQGESTVIGPDTFECLLIAADVALATDGAFDVAYASTRAADLPAAHPPYTLDRATHTLTSRAARLQLDLGAVGKGHALDRAAEILGDWGVTAACLVAGGSTVLALDPPPASAGWPIGIGDEPAVRPIQLVRAAVSASGTAVRGAHLIDPRRGQPAPRATRTWALADTAARSDALSTAFFVFTDAQIASFCAAHPDLGAAVTTAAGPLSAYGALVPRLRPGAE